MNAIPDAALQQHIAVLGKNGSGKTYTAKAVIVEPLLEAKRRVVVVDPTGAWWGLRSSRDGRGPGFQVIVLGGDHGDMALPANGGAAVARLATEQGVSLVADTSHFTVGERTRWFIAFADALFRTSKSPLHLVLDEAHNFAPQGGGSIRDPDVGKMLHAANQLAAGGRLRGIRLTMITQRPQKLHKDMLTSADTLIAMRVIHPLDRGAVKDWVDGCGDPVKGKAVLESLANLARGEGWVWYPEGGYLERMQFPHIRTFDSSATPAHGETIATPKGAAEINLAEIRTALADAVKEAEANDPKFLRVKIARLEKALAEGQGKPKELAVDVQMLARAAEDGQRSGYAAALKSIEPVVDRLVTLGSAIRETIDGLQADLARIQKNSEKIVDPPLSTLAKRSEYRVPPRSSPSRIPVATIANGTLQRILDALAELAALGVPQPERVQVAFLAGYSNLNSKGFTKAIGAARSGGLIDYPTQGCVALTEAGRAQANTPAEPKSSTELQQRVLDMLGGAHAKVLQPLIDVYPKSIARGELAARAGYTNLNSKGFTNAVGRLRSLGFIDYPAQGEVAAQPVLFIGR